MCNNYKTQSRISYNM